MVKYRPLNDSEPRSGMEIFINGEARQVADGFSVAELIDNMGLRGQRIAVEINLEIVPRSSHAAHRLRDGDRVEIVRAIGGG